MSRGMMQANDCDGDDDDDGDNRNTLITVKSILVYLGECFPKSVVTHDALPHELLRRVFSCIPASVSLRVLLSTTHRLIKILNAKLYTTCGRGIFRSKKTKKQNKTKNKKTKRQ